MQVRCQRCGYMFTLSRETVAAALEEAGQNQARHYAVDCPKCRHQIKVPVKDMRRFRPR
jgi:ribosomal protein S27E